MSHNDEEDVHTQTYQTGIALGRTMNPITIVMIPKMPVAMHIALTNSGATCPMNIEVASARRNTQNKTSDEVFV